MHIARINLVQELRDNFVASFTSNDYYTAYITTYPSICTKLGMVHC